MLGTDGGENARQVLFQVGALRHEQRCYNYAPVSRLRKLRDRAFKRGFHDFQKGELYRKFAPFAADRALYLFERLCPAALARAVRKQYERRPSRCTALGD